MIIIQICVGSSCHLKGAQELAELIQQQIKENNLDDKIILVGSLCLGKCNRVGVTISVDKDIYTGITPKTFKEFWNDKVLSRLMEEN